MEMEGLGRPLWGVGGGCRSGKVPGVKCHVKADAQETGSYQSGNEVASTGRLMFPPLLCERPC